MTKTNTWSIEVPSNDLKKQFKKVKLVSQEKIIKLLRELVIMIDPEDHNYSIDCPSIQGFNHAVKYILDANLILLVALDRVDSGMQIDRIITLYSCSE